jgi:hypothetical protein
MRGSNRLPLISWTGELWEIKRLSDDFGMRERLMDREEEEEQKR